MSTLTDLDTKICAYCGHVKPLDEFYLSKHGSKGRNAYCKECTKAKAKAWYNKNAERARNTRLAYYEKHRARLNKKCREYQSRPEVQERNKWRLLKRRIGYDCREQVEVLDEAQQSCCAVCGEYMEGINKHVDHCHSTGKIRGLLCSNCNTGIGLFRDDTARLMSAVVYLEAHQNANTS